MQERMKKLEDRVSKLEDQNAVQKVFLTVLMNLTNMVVDGMYQHSYYML